MTRIKITKNNTDEPEMIGMEGILARQDPDGLWLVFLDGDKFPTRLPEDEFEIMEAAG